MTATDAQASSLTAGTVVRYHGTLAAEHHATWYIQDIDHGLLTLADVDYPTTGVLRRVRPFNVTPTGRKLTLCACGHDETARTVYGHCAAVGCGCDDHGWNVR